MEKPVLILYTLVLSERCAEGTMVDTYTKFILTIIALALVVISVDKITGTAVAQIGYARVQVCDEQNCTRLTPIPRNVSGRTEIMWALPVVSTR
jgi:hypothetical protein